MSRNKKVYRIDVKRKKETNIYNQKYIVKYNVNLDIKMMQ